MFGVYCVLVRVRSHIIGNVRIKNVGKNQPCMVSKLPIICKQTVVVGLAGMHMETIAAQDLLPGG